MQQMKIELTTSRFQSDQIQSYTLRYFMSVSDCRGC